MAGGKKAWVTLATNDTYGLGALVLAHSLKKANTAYDLAILVTSNVTFAMRGALSGVFDEVKEVNVMDSGDVENLRLLARPELGVTFTKLHCWKLTQYDKCVFLDADTLVLQNCDELFDREELSAAPDVGWPDCFNSGVFVFKPSNETFKTIVEFALRHGSFDGGDQGLLNMYFSTWSTGDSNKRLPFLYNLSSAAIYSYLPAFKWFGKDVKIVHFIGNSKPWTQSFNPITRTVYSDPQASHLTNFLQYWWDLFCNNVHSKLSPEMSGLATALAQMKLDEPTPEQLAAEDAKRRENWEQGNIDYMGRDSFDNIWTKIAQTIGENVPIPSEEENADSSSQQVSEVPSEQPAASESTPTPKDAGRVVAAEVAAAAAPKSAEPVSCPRPKSAEDAAAAAVQSTLESQPPIAAVPASTTATAATVESTSVPEKSTDCCQLESSTGSQKKAVEVAGKGADVQSQKSPDTEPPSK